MSTNDLILTLDVDWAPDFVIDEVGEKLISNDIPATWFITHKSPAIDRLKDRSDLFEFGIHPNFLPGSSHGSTIEDVFKNCLDLVPDAKTMRTHSLYQSTPLFEYAIEHTPIRVDVSLFMPDVKYNDPFYVVFPKGSLLRLPFGWEDDFEMNQPFAKWDLESLPDLAQGELILNFHPIHILLNSKSIEPYHELKKSCPKISSASSNQLKRIANKGEGVGTLFNQAIEHIKTQEKKNRIWDVAKHKIR